jgi:dihydrodipicolinate synthase/N-acetylneuraminate lyase
MMKTSPVTPRDLAASVFAVPPLARDRDLAISRSENRKLIAHIESGGVTSLLYGGNACLFDLSLGEYPALLEFLAGAVAADTWLIPSAGPEYGRLLDQARIVRDLGFPTVMALPDASPSTPTGVATGLRRFAERFGRPIVAYIKTEGYLSPADVGRMFEDAVLCCVKYAVVRPDPADDAYLRALLDRADAARVVSGMGERPAVVHVRGSRLASFTSGLACIAPRAANRLLDLARSGEDLRATALRGDFLPLEALRERLGAIRVLHDAVTLSGIANMGPILPMQHNLEAEHHAPVETSVRALLERERALAA